MEKRALAAGVALAACGSASTGFVSQPALRGAPADAPGAAAPAKVQHLGGDDHEASAAAPLGAGLIAGGTAALAKSLGGKRKSRRAVTRRVRGGQESREVDYLRAGLEAFLERCEAEEGLGKEPASKAPADVGILTTDSEGRFRFKGGPACGMGESAAPAKEKASADVGILTTDSEGRFRFKVPSVAYGTGVIAAPKVEKPKAAPAAAAPAPAPAPAPVPEKDALETSSTAVFDDETMKACLPGDVYQRFKESLVSGAPTSEDDMKVLADALFKWARELGAVSFAHWFFPMRGGGGATGGALGAYKYDTLIDLDFSSMEATKPFGPTLPYERLFFGESDGSSFPNGHMRATHRAAAFTTWDRSSPCFVMDGVLRIPCAFVTHEGKCLDEKTPLLRSNDAVAKQAKRLLKNIGIGGDAKAVHSFLGWEQEFFLIKAEHFKNRPDLVNCGRTLLGALPPKNQQGELNYFGPPPESVKELLFNVQAEMLKLGVPVAVMHNEVAPAQHETCPIYGASTRNADSNVLFMEVVHRECQKLGLAALFHEKPFAGINGSGKHSNWSVQTDTGLNFFHPGKTEEANELFVTGIAALTYGLNQYNELVRCTAASAGNDHRLGAQEAPPAIISLFPGSNFEDHIVNIIEGGPLLGYKSDKTTADPRSAAAMAAPSGAEDRNRTAPFPHCSNRFEFRAVGSSQNCSFPVAVCNAIMAAGMAEISSLIEGGMSHRDAVAQVYRENCRVIFTGDCYSEEWPEEAEMRGLPNLKNTPLAAEHFNSEKNRELLADLGIYSEEECEARAEVMFESYISQLEVEVDTLLHMVDTGIIPACAKDLATYKDVPELVGDREAVYNKIKEEADKLRKLMEKLPSKHIYTGHLPLPKMVREFLNSHDVEHDAEYLCNRVKPQMEAIRKVVDEAELLLGPGLYPYPNYETMLYSHHA